MTTRIARRRLVVQAFCIKLDIQENRRINSDTASKIKANTRKQSCTNLILLTVAGSRGGFESRKLSNNSLYNKADIIKIRPATNNKPLAI